MRARLVPSCAGLLLLALAANGWATTFQGETTQYFSLPTYREDDALIQEFALLLDLDLPVADGHDITYYVNNTPNANPSGETLYGFAAGVQPRENFAIIGPTGWNAAAISETDWSTASLGDLALGSMLDETAESFFGSTWEQAFGDEYEVVAAYWLDAPAGGVPLGGHLGGFHLGVAFPESPFVAIGTPSDAAVPEPDALALAALGVCALGAAAVIVRRPRRRRMDCAG